MTVENLDDLPFQEVEFIRTFGGNNATSFAKFDAPTTITGNSKTDATFTVSGGGRPSVSVTVRYVNSRTGEKKSLSASGTVQFNKEELKQESVHVDGTRSRYTEL